MQTTNYDSQIEILRNRFLQNQKRHQGIDWEKVEEKLLQNPDKLKILVAMENSGGEPDLVVFETRKEEYIFVDCSMESPTGRRSFCYDRQALDARKENKPENNVEDAAKEIGAELLNEEEYRELQKFGPFDTKTSSWIKTTEAIRKLGGALFMEFRYGTVFIYHNGVQSYYAARGFRCKIAI